MPRCARRWRRCIMKYVLIIGDGIADEPVEQLGGRTPLAYLDCPNINTLAGGRLGMCQTVCFQRP